jgi:hypothetical protein
VSPIGTLNWTLRVHFHHRRHRRIRSIRRRHCRHRYHRRRRLGVGVLGVHVGVGVKGGGINDLFVYGMDHVKEKSDNSGLLMIANSKSTLRSWKLKIVE